MLNSKFDFSIYVFALNYLLPSVNIRSDEGVTEEKESSEELSSEHLGGLANSEHKFRLNMMWLLHQFVLWIYQTNLKKS